MTTQTHRKTRRTRQNTVLCWSALLALPLLSEGLLRVLYDPSGHTFAQRQSEVYGWLGMAVLLLVLVARPLGLIRQRRLLGLAALVFSGLHTWLAYQAVFDSDWESILFLSLENQWAIWLGGLALLAMLPMAATSTDWAMRKLGKHWKTLHRLGPVLTVFALLHTLWIGVHFGLTSVKWTSVLLIFLSLLVFFKRLRKAKRP